jgi:hypothetical protein
MTTENTDRFDMYTTIHKALRALMTDTLLAVGRVDPTDGYQVLEAGLKVRTLLDICRDHLHHENQILHPAMDARRPGSACVTSSQHVQHEEAFEKLEALVQTLDRSAGAARKTAVLNLYRALALFVAENFEHMQTEEVENNAVLWSAYSDAELIALHDEILSAVRPERMTVYSRWILPNINHAERLDVLNGLQHSMPEGAFAHTLGQVRDSISERDWSKIRDLFEPASTFQPA